MLAIERETEQKLAQLRAAEKKKVVKAQLSDADSIELKLKEMKVELAPEKVAEFAAKQKYVSGILEQFEIGVNNNQFAVAVAAVCDPKSKRQFLKVPSGMGKSRIIIAAIALKKLFHATNFFTVVFTSNLLRSAD